MEKEGFDSCLEDIIVQIEQWHQQDSMRIKVINDIRSAQKLLLNFEFQIIVKQHQPTYGTISYIHQDLSKYDSLKHFS